MAERVAIITGAGGGIGRATAIELSRRGFSVVLVGRTEKTLRETEKLVEHALLLVADITDVEQVNRIVEQTLSRFGRIDAIVNNAGIAPLLSIEKTTPQVWHEVIDTNLSAAFYLCRAVWPAFKRQGGGAVVNISSLAARDPFDGFLAYGAAKAGLNTFALALAREGAAIGVKVYTIAPGAVETAMFRALVSPQEFSTDKTLKPAEVAELIGKCIADESEYKSGEVIWLTKER
jgi:NAD(P)-dependent dehydrogenase (short-subunit alcohol dehydrogenase family)